MYRNCFVLGLTKMHIYIPVEIASRNLFLEVLESPARVSMERGMMIIKEGKIGIKTRENWRGREKCLVSFRFLMKQGQRTLKILVPKKKKKKEHDDCVEAKGRKQKGKRKESWQRGKELEFGSEIVCFDGDVDEGKRPWSEESTVRNSCHFVIRSSIAQKCNYHGTRFYLYADIHVSLCARCYVCTCTQRYRNKRERREVQCNSQAVLDIREAAHTWAHWLGEQVGPIVEERWLSCWEHGFWRVTCRILAPPLPIILERPSPFGQVCLHPSSIGRVAG